MIIVNQKLEDKVICGNKDTKLDENRVRLNVSGQNNESAKTSNHHHVHGSFMKIKKMTNYITLVTGSN